MKAEIFSIGTEILLGEILDSNAKFIAKELANIGVDVYYKTSVGDNEQRLLDSLKLSYSRSDIVIASGGLGPTDDDLTKETFAKFFGKELIESDIALKNLQSYFTNPDTMPKSNLKQIYLPEGCTVLYNDNGTASGFIIDEKDKIAVVMPGPPRELVPMFKDKVIPYLEKKTNKVLVSKSLNLIGIGESLASETIKDLMLTSENPTIAPYAGDYEMRFRITASGSNRDEATALLKPTSDKLYEIFGEFIYGENDDNLQSVIVSKLIEKGLTISIAESCTGGLISSTLVDVPSVSKTLLNGVVSYSNESKIYELGVKSETLEQFGAVSENVALEMAKGIREKSKSSIGLAVTGIAGPDGGTSEKPVGLVYIALDLEGQAPISKEIRLTGTRNNIRQRTLKEVFNQLFKAIR